ncbi:hypothetical protein [Paenibacillus sp. FSL H7-0714]|uniref:hypothetical protein n=1 Tax=Paenibacillus sp. FSL H7-0714 TaxID=2954735 RepID=UPI0030FC4B9C
MRKTEHNVPTVGKRAKCMRKIAYMCHRTMNEPNIHEKSNTIFFQSGKSGL